MMSNPNLTAHQLSSTRAEPLTMQVMRHGQYGGFEQLALQTRPRPVAGRHQVLVRVHAAGLHVGDCFGVRGRPFGMRLVSGVFAPKHGIPGFDLAGQVEAVGEGVTRFKAGDAVFGTNHGSCAEYVAASDDKLALKPAQLSFAQAAALPTSGLAALHALRDVGKVHPGQRVLINAAAGGVGSFAVQIAKALGAEVTGVCSTGNVAWLRALGADHVVDYTREDFTKAVGRYDLMLDNLENRALSDCRRALTPNGTLILNSGSGATGLALMVRLLKPLMLSPFVHQSLRRYISVPSHADLVCLKALVETGRLLPHVDRTYPLGQTAAALRHIEGGHARGKTVVTL